jgi:predicted nucleic acid-binding protein
MRFLDTNIVIRYLTKDDPVKAAACFTLIQAIKHGRESVETTESVIAEAVYILSSPKHYHLSHDEVVTDLAPVVQLRGLKVPRKRVILRSLALYKQYTHLDFEDCISIATMENRGISEIVSYDRGFDKVPGIARQEP